MGIGHAVIPPAEQAVAEDAAGADGDLAALLLVDDVLPGGFVGCPAGGILRVDNGQNAVPLVALADLIAEKGKTPPPRPQLPPKMAPMIYFQLRPAANIMQQPMMA